MVKKVEEMMVRRIDKIEDVLELYNGIQDGINLGSFTNNKMMDILNLIVSKNTMYYLFEEGTELIGFGGIRDNVEVFKVYVMPKYRGHNYGKKISLFLTNKIFKNGQIPVCWVKKQNVWNNAMAEMGMETTKDGCEDVNHYRLLDLKAYINALEKYDIESIEVKRKIKVEIPWGEFRRNLGRC